VGKDNFGDFLLNNLKTNHVDSQLVQRDGASTGTAIIVVDSNGQNSIVLSPGANGKVATTDVESASFLNHNLLLLQLEIPMLTVLRAAERAKENNVRVILNPAPAKEIPDELIALVDFIIPNETELSLLTGMDVNDIPSAEKAAKQLLERGAKNVIVTLGSKGALLVKGKPVTKYRSMHADTFHVNTYPVDVVDTTAAGDAFIGGFAVSLESSTLVDAVRYGCACGALATTKFGAQPSLPSKTDVEKFLSAAGIS
jgi:ribokinase